MLILVTGSTGFLGRRVVQRLLEHHHRVRCLVHTPGGERVFEDRSLDIYYGSVTDLEALSEAFQGVDAVIHLVAIIGQRRNEPSTPSTAKGPPMSRRRPSRIR